MPSLASPRDHIRIATPQHRAGVIATTVTAFEQDPAFRFFFPSDDEYQSEAPKFVGALFDNRVDHNGTWVMLDPDRDKDDPAAVMSLAMWAPATAPAHGADLRSLSAASIDRLKRYDEATNDGLPTDDFWYLGILATHPSHAGHAYGRTMMEPGLSAAATAGYVSYLETTNVNNVAMYQRSGWTITASNTIEDLDVTVLSHPGT